MKMAECRWCGLTHGPQCPSIKGIEYFENGVVKRVEFVTAENAPMVWPTKTQTVHYPDGSIINYAFGPA